MRVHTLSERYRDPRHTRNWLLSLPGDGTAYLTDLLKEFLPEGGQRWLMPDGPGVWEELPRPGDKEAAAACAAAGRDVLFFVPSYGRRRIFVKREG